MIPCLIIFTYNGKSLQVYTTSGYGRRAIGNCISPEIERVMQEGASYFRQIGMDVKEVRDISSKAIVHIRLNLSFSNEL